MKHIYPLKILWEQVWAQNPPQELDGERPTLAWKDGPFLNVKKKAICFEVENKSAEKLKD